MHERVIFKNQPTTMSTTNNTDKPPPDTPKVRPLARPPPFRLHNPTSIFGALPLVPAQVDDDHDYTPGIWANKAPSDSQIHVAAARL